MNRLQRLLFGCALACAASATLSADLLIEDVTLISPELATPLPARHVLIRDGRIAQISERPIVLSDKTPRLDGHGRYLTPGLMDSHVHVGEAPGLPPASEEPAIVALRDEFIRQQPRSYLYFGVTQVMDLASRPQGLAAFEAQPRRPDLFHCGPAIVVGGYPATVLNERMRSALLPMMVFEPANAATQPLPAGEDPAQHTPEAVIATIAASGARCVKIFIENGFGERSDWPMMSRETLQRVRAETRKRGLPLVAHANAIDMQRIAVELGVDVIAHGLWNWNEYAAQPGIPDPIGTHLRELHAKRIGYQPTLRVIPGMADLFRADTLEDPTYAKVVPASLLAWYTTEPGQWFKRTMKADFGDVPDSRAAQILLQVNEHGMRVVRQLQALGHPFLLGSDTPSSPTFGNQPGYDTYREMRLMALSGVPLDAVLRAGTINNARQFGMEKDYGTIAKGRIANLLLLEENPLESIVAWSRINSVILHGVVIERSSLAADSKH
jgi:imidazolonepropionase-like amidohydrolase